MYRVILASLLIYPEHFSPTFYGLSVLQNGPITIQQKQIFNPKLYASFKVGIL